MKNPANEMFKAGKIYLIYRVYFIDETTHKAKIKVYQPIFNDQNYDLKPRN